LRRGPEFLKLGGVTEETSALPLHPLNQAAEMLLRRLTVPQDPALGMSVIQLAVATLPDQPPHPLPGEQLIVLKEWDDPKWRRRALHRLERRLSPTQLLMHTPAEAGRLIAEILLDGPRLPWSPPPLPQVPRRAGKPRA
jgi:hypothetical protein